MICRHRNLTSGYSVQQKQDTVDDRDRMSLIVIYNLQQDARTETFITIALKVHFQKVLQFVRSNGYAILFSTLFQVPRCLGLQFTTWYQVLIIIHTTIS